MSPVPDRRREVDKAADIVRDAGGRVVGRTRLQKIAYLLEAAGLGEGFKFSYRYYGPYSEDLTNAAWQARLLGLIEEEEKPASWGGSYSVFTASPSCRKGVPGGRLRLIEEASQADPIALELAATAAFLAAEGSTDPWTETAKRKPDKAKIGLGDAKALYAKLRAIDVPRRLPAIA